MKKTPTEERRCCGDCKQSFPLSAYSKSQLKKPHPKCTQCINRSNSQESSKLNNVILSKGENILCLDLDDGSFCDIMGDDETLRMLKKEYPSLLYFENFNDSRNYLLDPVTNPIAFILSLRPEIIKETGLVEYVKRGGCAIFCGLFSSWSQKEDFSEMFTHFGLPWTPGGSVRTTYQVAPNWVQNVPTLESFKHYSVKAQQLKNVSQSDSVYRLTEESKPQLPGLHDNGPVRLVFSDMSQTPLAFAPVGQGYICYVGDVNFESDTAKIIISLSKWRLQSRSKGMKIFRIKVEKKRKKKSKWIYLMGHF